MADFKRILGKTNEKVHPIGLGCMGMSASYGPADEEESIKVLERAVELGCTFWDTADMYGYGGNELLLSKVLKSHREKIFLCTKFGIKSIVPGQSLKICGTPEYVREAFEKSIERLGVDYVDLYYQHRVDPDTPIEETVKAMAELVKEGKVRYLGLSECSANTLRRAYKVHPIAAVQMEYSPWALDIEKNDLLKAARELGVSIVCYSPLGRGFLTGAIRTRDDLPETDFRKMINPRFSEENFSKNFDLVKQIEKIAAEKNITASQLVLAWVLAQGDDFIIIPGTKRIKYLEENFAAQNVELTKDDIAALRKIAESADIQGDRYDKMFMTSIDTE